MPGTTPALVRVVILGNDAFLAARPARPLQLVRACQRAGFSLVAPVSWGEELLAMRVAERVRRRAERAVVVAHCPCVADAVRSTSVSHAGYATAVSPPRATARFLRTALTGRTVHVAYVGDCPGAHQGGDIDTVFSPPAFLGRLHEAGIILDDLPPQVEEQLPPERARHASLPGGVPETAWLEATAGATVREAAPATIGAVLATAGAEPLVLDLASAAGCACARDRFAVARLEPARSATAVLHPSELLDLADPTLELELLAHRTQERDAASQPGLMEDVRVSTAHEAPQLIPSSMVFSRSARSLATRGEVAHNLTTSIEPWVRATGHRAPPLDAAPQGPAGQPVEVARDIEAPVAPDATGHVRVAAPAPGPSGGLRATAHTSQSGVRPRSLSPVPPVISPALRSVMDVLEAQNRETRRRAVRTYGVVGVVVVLASLAVLARWPVAPRALDRAGLASPAFEGTSTTAHDSIGPSPAPGAATSSASVRDSLRDGAGRLMGETGTSSSAAPPDRP